MGFDAHKNFAFGTVLTPPSPATSGTSIILATGDGAKFPATPFNATVSPAGLKPTSANAEVVRVTAIAGDVLTITRTQEGSTARAISAGDEISDSWTAKKAQDVELSARGGITFIFKKTANLNPASGEFTFIGDEIHLADRDFYGTDITNALNLAPKIGTVIRAVSLASPAQVTIGQLSNVQGWDFGHHFVMSILSFVSTSLFAAGDLVAISFDFLQPLKADDGSVTAPSYSFFAGGSGMYQIPLDGSGFGQLAFVAGAVQRLRLGYDGQIDFNASVTFMQDGRAFFTNNIDIGGAKVINSGNPGAMAFGNGSDGNLVFDGTSAVAGCTLVSANIYRLDRDLYANNLTVNNGVTVKPGNATAGSTPTWKIFCAGTLTINGAGTITNSGTDGASASGATGGTPAGGGPGNAGGSLGGSGNGATGRNGGTGVGTNGGASSATDPSGGGSGGSGGAGGNGLSGGGGAGAAGAATPRQIRFIDTSGITLNSAGVITTLRGGTAGGSGGAGGGNGTANGGGSGASGGGGGHVFIWAKSIVNNGTITAKGGNGGNGGDGGTAGGGATGGGGGGGAGGGGRVYLVYGSYSGSGSISVSGGTKGTGGNGGNSGTAGGNGVDGAAGEVIKINITTGVYE